MSILVDEREKIYFMVSDHYLSPIVMILSGLSPLSLGREGGYERLEFIVVFLLLSEERIEYGILITVLFNE